MPQTRIANSLQGLGLGRDMSCDTRPGSKTPCSQMIEVALTNGGTDSYTFRLDNPGGGVGLLIKNGRLIWSGQTNGAGSPAVLSSKRIGDEIAFDYSKSNWGSGEQHLWVTDSILMTKGKAVVLIPNSFAPYPIHGQLIYFRIRTRKDILVFGGKEVGEEYDEVFDLPCCWAGPPLQIAANGEGIDFFAQKGRDWYHVQAGYLIK